MLENSYNIFPLVSSGLLLLTILFGVIYLFRFVERSYPRNMLIAVMSVWFPFVLFLFVLLMEAFSINGQMYGYMGNLLLLSGNWGILMISLYAASVIFHTRFNLRNILIFISPAIFLVTANMLIHFWHGIPLLNSYVSWGDFMENISSPIAVIRIVMLVMQLLYLAFLSSQLLQLIPICNNYLQNNESEERYSLDWLYQYIAILLTLSVVYTALVIVHCPLTLSVYCLTVMICFVVLINSSRLYKIFPHFDKLQITWSYKNGWERLTPEVESKGDEMSDRSIDDFCDALYCWLMETKYYSYSDFSMMDVVTKFSDIDTITLIDILDKRGYTFQSYIREIRINEALRIIDHSEGGVLLKDLFSEVGFSHYSSFSRAFTAVVGLSPSAYIRQSR